MIKLKPLPAITINQTRDLDRFMTHKTGIPVLVMMEHAGLAVARVTQDMLGKRRQALIIAGSGHNGGDGLVVARHLANWGYRPTVIMVKGRQTKKATKKQIYMLRQMKQSITLYHPKEHQKIEKLIGETDLVIDAIIGYSLRNKLRLPAERIVNSINQSSKPVIAVDGPSGLNFDTGIPQPIAVKATTTVTLALPKLGLTQATAKQFVGELMVAYLSVPDSVYHKLGIPTQTQFAQSQTVKIN